MDDFEFNCVLRNSEKVNLDGLFRMLLYLDNDLKEIKANLLQAYFIIAEWVADDSDNACEEVKYALLTLRDLIESLEDVNKPEQAKIKLIAK